MLRRRKTKAKRTKPRSRAQRILLKVGWLIPIAALLAGSGVLVFTYAFATIPLPRDTKLESATTVYDRTGKEIGIYTGEQRRFLLNDKQLARLFDKAPYVGQAVIAAEDKDFYEHDGVSFRGLARAPWANLTGGEVLQGGSTISQQYVKNAVLKDPSRTITRKFKEAILAIKLERRYSKRQILGFYLDTIYLGRGAYGIQAAALAYFGKDADELTLPEAAYLAGIIPSPESYQPDVNMKAARQRRNHVLDVMAQEGMITKRRARLASRGKVEVVEHQPDFYKEQKAAYFMEWLRAEYLDPLLGSCAYTCGLKVYTTLDLEAQDSAESSLSLTHQKGWPQAALVSMTPTGEVRAMVGGKKYEDVKAARGFNYATTPPGRQPGSAFKPFTLATAIDQDISPSSYFSGSSPKTIDDPECGIPSWEVENYGGSSYGTIDLRTATTNSVNTVYAQLIAETGADAVADTVTDFGFQPPPGVPEIRPRCSLALGGYIDVTPLQMARAYAGFNARGVLPEVNPVRFIRDNDNECITATGPASIEKSLEEARATGQQVIPKVWADCDEEIEPVGKEVLSETVADNVNQVLTGVTTSGTATSANLYEYEESGKTGTSQENVNAWFAGSVPPVLDPEVAEPDDTGLTTVVWMGYPLEEGKNKKSARDDYTPQMRYCYDPNPNLCRPVGGIDVTGGSYPAQMWADYMSNALPALDIDPASYPEPADLPDNLINSPPPSDDGQDDYVPPSTEEPSDEPSEEPTETAPPTSEPPPPPPPPTSEPPSPPPTSEGPPTEPPTDPPTTHPPPEARAARGGDP